ncbi:RNA-directed RNA polymerase 2 [Mycena alexandri]|uniref:RNA-dependent RNA polymerase n=1 Tax=Mycena alexandri TaxID=1745969 RepID=A0AAD6X826_9AGAR|nr:RNA-directed RNA polymerase 2 [Mycena alexandri]
MPPVMVEPPPAMDVHMQGISFSVNKHQLVAELANILHRPPYAAFSTVLGPVNFHVYLFKDSRGNKAHSGSGCLTLLTNAALHFLREYGEQPGNRPPLKAFTIGGRRVKFAVGKSKPRQDVVDRIQRFPYVDPAVAQQKEQRANVLQSGLVKLRTLQFGWDCRDSVFSVEWEAVIDGALQVNDERREFRIEIIQPTKVLYVAIRFSRISYIQIHSEMGTNASIIFFNLSEPPNFESGTGSGQRQRLSYLPLSDHERVAPFTSLAIRLVCGNQGDGVRFQRLARTAGIRNVYDSELHIERRGLFSAQVLDEVKAHIEKLRWSVAFQVQSILQKLDLDAKELLELIPHIRQLVYSKGRSYATSFLRHFSGRVRYWSVFDLGITQTIQQFFIEVLKEFAKFYAKAPSLTPTDNNNSVFQSLHVVITPTTMYLEGPFPGELPIISITMQYLMLVAERSNRVIRSFDPKNHDSFLRVSFEDEGSLKYRFDKELNCVEFTRRRVGEFLIDRGLIIAGRKFTFLAYSQSALKEHAVWFMRPFKAEDGTMVTTKSIINNLGSFDGLEFDPQLRYCPARYAARISQAFTATDSTSIEVEEVFELEEISDVSGKYHFTDGVGTMSLELAQAIWDELRASRRRNRRVKNHPRAYQIRFDGCKGMLSVDYKLKGHVMCLRPSMIKFSTTARSRTIDIARAFDKPGLYYLNRPLIMLLEGLGVPYTVFKGCQDTAVREVQQSTESLAAFARMLEMHGLGTAYRLPSVLLGLNQLGIDLSGNKFYRKMLDFAVHHVLRLLKNKARIPVKGGVTVVGVADVHRFLREGEIFVCTREPDSNRLKYLQGDVLISRSPTIHPGDVQLVRAIGAPPPGSCFAQEPLPNTVVFSVLGERPLPSCCGGGDLDGDVYNIIPLNACPGFRPQVTHQPGDYSPAQKKLVTHPSTMVDVAEFVIEFINSDALGVVAINWLLIADQSKKFILDPDCMKLAALHSDAADYPKTGRPVAINTIPKPKSNLKPDWHAPEVIANMGDYYKSDRAIGKLFRAINLPDVQHAATLSQFERRMIREGRMRPPQVDDLAETLEGLDLDDDPMVLAIQTNVARFIETTARPPEIGEYIAQIFNRYASELQGICVAHTLSHGKTALLSEEEAVVGTIVAKTSQPRKRQDLIASLREKSDILVRGVKEELLGDDDVSWDECLQRAWLSFELAIELAGGEQKSFGAVSFIWIALGAIFDAVKELEDEEKVSRSSGRHF